MPIRPRRDLRRWFRLFAAEFMLKELGDEAKTLPAYKATMVPAPVLAAAREARKWLIDPLIAAENARLRAKT